MELKELTGKAKEQAYKETENWEFTHFDQGGMTDFKRSQHWYLELISKKNRIIYDENGHIVGDHNKYFKTKIIGGANNVYMNVIVQAIVEKKLSCKKHTDNKQFKWHNRVLSIRPFFWNRLQLGYIILDKNWIDGYVVYDIQHNVIQVYEHANDIDIFIEDDHNLVALYDTLEHGFVMVRTFKQLDSIWDVSDHSKAQLSYLETLERETDKDKIISIKSLILHEYEKIQQ